MLTRMARTVAPPSQFTIFFSPEAKRLTLAFSCGARSVFTLKAKDYLRSMLSRRQLQGFVGWRAIREAS